MFLSFDFLLRITASSSSNYKTTDGHNHDDIAVKLLKLTKTKPSKNALKKILCA
jgi:hypothetical protein